MRGEPIGPGFRIERHATVSSTNDLLREHALAGEPEGLLLTAAAQSAGRGRHGRRWASPPAGNLYASLLLRPRGSLAKAATLSLVTALSVTDALAPLLAEPDRLRVKWPNDVLLDSAKLAGILLEGADDGSGGCAWLLVGLGVNLATAPDGVPIPATSLAAATGIVLTPEAFLERWLPALRVRLDVWRQGGFAALRPDWLARAHGLGRPASLRIGDELVQGRLADLGEDGALLLENELGCISRYSAGELFFP